MSFLRFEKMVTIFSSGMDNVTHWVTWLGYPLVMVGYKVGYLRWLQHAVQIARQGLQKIVLGS